MARERRLRESHTSPGARGFLVLGARAVVNLVPRASESLSRARSHGSTAARARSSSANYFSPVSRVHGELRSSTRERSPRHEERPRPCETQRRPSGALLLLFFILIYSYNRVYIYIHVALIRERETDTTLPPHSSATPFTSRHFGRTSHLHELFAALMHLA